MFLKLIILSLLVVTISFLFMGIRVLFSHTRRFPVTDIAKNPGMKKLGIVCPHAMDALSQSGKSDFAGCAGCALLEYNKDKDSF